MMVTGRSMIKKSAISNKIPLGRFINYVTILLILVFKLLRLENFYEIDLALIPIAG